MVKKAIRVPEKAKELELQALEDNKINLANLPKLDQILSDIFVTRRPKPIEYNNRRDLVRIFNVIAKEIYGNSDESPVVEVFGSFLMDMFTTGSDLDLSVNFSNQNVELPREKKIQSLRKFAKRFYALQRRGHVTGIQVITSARVPIVKVVDQGTEIECDLSVENREGILNSELIRIMSTIDERFQKLSFLMKVWANAHGINRSKDRTLNSLSIISMVAFHLQNRDPPILPPFSAIFKDGTNPRAVKKLVQKYLNYGKENKESLAKLFVTLFIKLGAVEKLWQKGLCISVYEGSWIYKRWESKRGCITVEDFTDRSLNIARAVGPKKVQKIHNSIRQTLGQLLAFLDGMMWGDRIKMLLFDADSVAEGNGVKRNHGSSHTQLAIHQDPHQVKKMRLTESERSEVVRVWSEEQTANLWVGAQTAKGVGGMPAGNLGQHAGGSGGTKPMQMANGWGAMQVVNVGQLAGGWGVSQPVQKVNGWGEMSVAKVGQLAGGWGGTQPAGSWGATQPNWVAQPRASWQKDGWRGTQPAGSWGATQPNWVAQPTASWQKDGWGGTQPAGSWGATQPNWVAQPTASWQKDGWGGTESASDWGRMRAVNGWEEDSRVVAWRTKRQAISWGASRLNRN